MKENRRDLLTLEKEYDRIKKVMGDKLAEYRQFAGFPKRTYPNSKKSANLLFNHEGGISLPNEDTVYYYTELYCLNDEQRDLLLEIQKEGKKIKAQILRIKRGW